MSQSPEPNALLNEEEEKQKQMENNALEECYHGACILTAGLRKLLEAKGRTFKKEAKT